MAVDDAKQYVLGQGRLYFDAFADGVDRDFPTDKLYQLHACVQQRLSRLIATTEFPDEFMLGLYRKGTNGIRIGPGVVGAVRPDVSDRSFFRPPLVVELVLEIRQPFVV